MALFRIAGCVLQVVLTDCRGRPVPDLELVVERAGSYTAGAIGDCGALARLLKPVIEGLSGCEALVEPFPGENPRAIMALRLG